MSNQALAIISVAATLVVTIANVLLVIFTRRYVQLTAAMVEHMRSAQAASVVADITFGGTTAYLTIANTGTKAATNLVFETLTGLEWSGEKNVKSLAERGISYLPSGRTMRFWLGHPDWKGIEEEHPLVRIDLKYDVEGKVDRRQFLIDMSQYVGTSVERAPEDRIVDALRELVRAQRGGGSLAFKLLEQKKQCIACAEKIPIQAKKCSHCLTDQPSDIETSSPDA